MSAGFLPALRLGFLLQLVLNSVCVLGLCSCAIHAQNANNFEKPPSNDRSVLDAWHANRLKASRGIVNVVVIGDSIACCFGPADYQNVWTNVLRRAEVLSIGDHGSGIIPIGNDFDLATNPQWSLHPDGGSIDTVPFGPFQPSHNLKGAFNGVFRLSGAAHATVLLPVRPPDGIILYYASASDSAGGIRVAYDDHPGEIVGRQTSSAYAAHSATLPNAPKGAVSINLSAASSTGSVYLYGVEFTFGNKGVSLHNLAHGYARSEAWGAFPDKQLAFLHEIRGGIQLAILSLGGNDSINGTGLTAHEYHDYMAAIVRTLRTLDPKMPIVIFDEVPIGLMEKATVLPQRLVREQERALATEFNLGYVSPQHIFGDLAANAVARGYFSRDAVHPSDLGDRLIERVIEQYLESSISDHSGDSMLHSHQ